MEPLQVPPRLFISDDKRSIVNSKKVVVDFGDDVNRIKTLLSTVGNGLLLKKSGIPNAGFGVFATRQFAKNEIITYFDGAVSKRISVTEIEPSYKTHARRLNSFYTMYGNFTESGERIDLTQRGFKQVMGKGAGAFINAKSGGLANCGWYVLRSRTNEGRTDETEDPFQIVILIYALERIYAESELFIDYGEQYWREETEQRGTLIPTFITKEAYYRAIEEEKAQASRRVVKRLAPTLITQEDESNKKQRVDQCVQCLLATPFVDTQLMVFLCSTQCRDVYTL